jgi:hypothetical protein
VYASLLYSETLYTTFFLLFLYVLLSYVKTGALGEMVGAAVLLASTAYIRPVSYFLPPLVTALLFLRLILTKSFDRRLLLHATAFFVISMGLIGLWQVRNKLEADYSGFSAITAQNLYFYIGAHVLAEIEGTTLGEQQARMGYGNPSVYFALHPEQREWGQSRIYQYKAREGIKLVLQHPWTYFMFSVKGTVKTFRDSGAAMVAALLHVDPESPRGTRLIHFLRLPLFAVLLVYWGLAVVGIFSRRWINGWQMVIVAVLSLYLLLIPGVSGAGYARFRHPVMPVICLMAGCGLSAVVSRLGFVSAQRASGRLP